VWLVAVLVSAFLCFLGVGEFSHVGVSSVVALVFGCGMDSCQTSVILNICIKRDIVSQLLPASMPDCFKALFC
jgi:hypothetical protein